MYGARARARPGQGFYILRDVRRVRRPCEINFYIGDDAFWGRSGWRRCSSGAGGRWTCSLHSAVGQPSVGADKEVVVGVRVLCILQPGGRVLLQIGKFCWV